MCIFLVVSYVNYNNFCKAFPASSHTTKSEEIHSWDMNAIRQDSTYTKWQYDDLGDGQQTQPTAEC
jgi:hypothetical protein